MTIFDAGGWSRVHSVCLAALLLGTAGPSGSLGEDLSRRPLEHEDYDVWNTISLTRISRDGAWVMYSVQSGAIDGEATLHIHNTETSREYVIERGARPRFTWDSRFAVFLVTPDKDVVKALRKKDTPAEDLPQSELQVLNLETGGVVIVERVESFDMPAENADWVSCPVKDPKSSDAIEDLPAAARETYEVTAEGLRRPARSFKLKSREALAIERGEMERPEPETEPPEEETEIEGEDGEDNEDENRKPEGSPLRLIHLPTGVTRTYPDVVSGTFSKQGDRLAFVTSVRLDDSTDEQSTDEQSTDEQSTDEQSGDGVHVIDLESMRLQTVACRKGEYKSLAWSDDGSHLAFITNRDNDSNENPSWSVYHWKAGWKEARKVATEGDDEITFGWWVSPRARLQFSEDGRRLYFDVAPVPDEVVKERESATDEAAEDEDDDESVKLDIWHWQDPQLQPQQILQAERERDRRYRAAYVLKSRRIAQLATREIPVVSIDPRSASDVAIANTNQKYRKELSWDVPGFRDVWLVDLDTGKQTRLLEKVKWEASLSPEGRYAVWFDAERKQWFAKPTDDVDAAPVTISEGIDHPLQDELHDTPSLPPAYGSAGWMANDRAFLVYDRYDIWRLDPTGQSTPICVTQGYGRENEIRFRYRVLDDRQRAIDPKDPMLLSAYNRETKASGFYVIEPRAADDSDEGDASPPRRLMMLDESIGGLRKAQDGSRVIFTRSTFRRCPDLWTSDLDFRRIQRISDINPQQSDYRWGDAKLVHWRATDGQELDGILMTPDGFDPSKKYPMIVYFYERNSDNLHRYYPPAAGRSIICHSFYVSRGYLVFIPDIPYRMGEPGPSAANSILSGVDFLVEQGFVDEAKIGMQGHSWGGYQTAYLVTQTDRFACAESGAPVSNMTSAYGGIRWGSGLSRMFQYERTQSRIGDDLWSARESYIANSPLFFADQINTPLLILHNDEDGAVPWYQGIELFVALRRLEKPVWMLNYNGNPHWVMGDRNRRDFAIRMQQFFDHYLMDAPEPEWMAVGVPAVDKGNNDGLELLEPESASSGEDP